VLRVLRSVYFVLKWQVVDEGLCGKLVILGVVQTLPLNEDSKILGRLAPFLLANSEDRKTRSLLPLS
jgi:hypothetical protein